MSGAVHNSPRDRSIVMSRRHAETSQIAPPLPIHKQCMAGVWISRLRTYQALGKDPLTVEVEAITTTTNAYD
jgi:hypothetical protein